MRRHPIRSSSVELGVGLGLLIGPLVLALTLTCASAPQCSSLGEGPGVGAVPSEIAAEPTEIQAAPEPMPRAEFLFVTDAGIVLSTEAERSWGTGELFEPKGELRYRVGKRADPSAIPAGLWSMQGRSFDLYGSDARVCTAQLGELRVIAQYDGWGLGGVLGEEWFDRDPEEASAEQIRTALWQRDDLWLVAEIVASDSCEGALWARDAELPPPEVLRPLQLPNPAGKSRPALLERFEELAELERHYLAAYARADEHVREYFPSWEQLFAEHHARTLSWVDAQGRSRVVGLEFVAGDPDACGGPLSAWVSTLDLMRGLESATPPHPHAPGAVIDVDLDGQWELLYSEPGSHVLISATVDAHAVVEEDFVCPC